MSQQIERLIREGNWSEARRVIQAELKQSPQDHWLLTRLSLTYYEEKQYTAALKYTTEALSIAPRCPLALWDHAGTLEMLGREAEAIAIFRRLIRRGVTAIATGPCGEGRGWARGLLADCHYRIAGCLDSVRDHKGALQAFEKHLELRGPGCRSIYSLKEVSIRATRLKKYRPNNTLEGYAGPRHACCGGVIGGRNG